VGNTADGKDDPAVMGTFPDEKALNEGMVLRLKQSQKEGYVKALKEMIHLTFHGNRCVFTHGDLQFKNVMVERVGQELNGCGKFKLTLIDWTAAGWYPEYWEYCHAVSAAAFQFPESIDALKEVLDPYLKEYPLIWLIRRLVLDY
jgi:thiamine kinase-like enzyme